MNKYGNSKNILAGSGPWAFTFALMSKKHTAKDIEARLSRAKATNEYRRLLSPLQKAVWLHLEYAIPQTRAASEEKVSRAAVQRGIAAQANNRQIGLKGRPKLLNSEQVGVLTEVVLSRAKSLNCMHLSEVGDEVR